MASGFQIAVLLCLASVLLTAETVNGYIRHQPLVGRPRPFSHPHHRPFFAPHSSEVKKPCCSVCPAGWTQFGHRCFMFHFLGKNWYDSERDCLRMEGNLASVHSEEEHDFLRDYIHTVTNSYRRVWLGGHDAVKEGFWMWADGSKFGYTRWSAREPNNLRQEHCLEMNWRGSFWNDRRCTAVLPYVCSRDLPCCDRNH